MSADIIAILESKGLKVVQSSHPKRAIKLSANLVTELGDSDARCVQYAAEMCMSRLAAPTIIDGFENKHGDRTRHYNTAFAGTGKQFWDFYRLNRLRGNSYLSFLMTLETLQKMLKRRQRTRQFSETLTAHVAVLDEIDCAKLTRDYNTISTATKLERLAMLDAVRTRILALVAE